MPFTRPSLPPLVAVMLILACCLITLPASAVTLSQIISREHPALDIPGSHLAIGRDGLVYLGSNEYVLRIGRDGTGKIGSKTVYATWNVAANKDGIIATANAHFIHSVNLWSPAFEKIGGVSDFLSSDPTEWFGPCDVQVGASGDFYGADQNRNRIIRLKAPGTMITTYALAGTGENFVRRLLKFRVWEAGQRFYVCTDKGIIYALGFDGTVAWKLDAGIGGDPWNGYRGTFDVDDAGTLYILLNDGNVVKRYGPDGKPAGEITLAMQDRKSLVTDLRVYSDDLVIKRRHPIELFQVYDRTTGAFRRAVNADVEQLQVNYPSEVWTAGQPVPLAIQFTSANPALRPKWRVWLRPFNTPEFTELPLKDGAVIPPADAGGLYQLRISPELTGGNAEYTVQEVVEIRQPNAHGTLSILTPNNRLYYGQGEEIPVTVIARGITPKTVTVQLLAGKTVLAEQQVEFTPDKPAQFTLAKTLTAALAPGRYLLTSPMPDVTVAAQPLIIGAGIATPPAFSIVQHGDYSAAFPTGSFLDAPENIFRHLNRASALHTNMFVDRLGHDGSGVRGSLFAGSGTEALVERLKKDPAGVAPEKAVVENPLKQTVAAYGAQGIEERGILLTMDAGLPVGTGFDGRSVEQDMKDLTAVTNTLAPYPAFRGWSWAANWWLSKHGATAANSPEQKTAYEAALKKANETGAWDPVLDQVSDLWLHYAIDAEKAFHAALQQAAPGKISAMTGPYRAVTVIPPLSFQGADEVDLQYQAEQIQPPQVTPHNVDFYKRPGKRAWGHPELWNDDGTGGQIFPTLFQMAMRGADGVGWSGNVPAWGTPPSDPRAAGMGTVSIFRSLDTLFAHYGPWLTTLHANDHVAIIASGRMLRLDNWQSIGGQYFDRLYEAYNACLYAHRPASYVFSDDLTPTALQPYKVILVVGQRVELEPALLEALLKAQAAGAAVLYDGNCRAEVVKDFKPLDITFNKVEKDPSAWQDDSAYTRFPGYFIAHAAALARVLDPILPPVANVENPEIMLTERVSGDGRYLWVVNNTTLGLDPGLTWRTGLAISTRLPLVAPVGITGTGTIYDIFALKQVTPVNGVVQADLRTLPARLYAVLPKPIAGIYLRVSKSVKAGQDIDWHVEVTDTGGKSTTASIPVCVQLLAGTEVLAERYVAAEGGKIEGIFTLPITVNTTMVTLQATELISGRQALLWIEVKPAGKPVPLTQGQGKDETSGTKMAASTVKSTNFSAEEDAFGPHLKDIALSADGSQALLNAMNWDENLYALDVRSGKVAWRGRVGHHFAYGPQAVAGGYAVQGFDLHTAEGYHLYLLDRAGKATRRFALYGLPKRATSWANASTLTDNIDNFAAAPDRSWVAAAGDLGLAVWDANGKLRWSQDWWKTTRKRVVLLAQDNDTLITLDGMTATAWQASNGKARWQLTLDTTGTLQGGEVSADRHTLALRSSTKNGRVYLLRAGKVINTLATPADALALSPDGTHLAVTTGKELKWYAVDGGLEWTFTGDDTLRNPRIAPDGKRVVCGSELGILYVLDGAGAVLLSGDMNALPVAAWLPGGDLLVASWMGTVIRLDGKYEPRWQVHLQPLTLDSRPRLLADDPTPTVRMANWGNAETAPDPLTPNLLKDTRALIKVTMSDREQEWQQKVDLLCDGKPEAPKDPWLKWTTINYIDSGWSGSLMLNVDTFHTQLRVTGITVAEDPAHPESWLRDMRLQYWDAAKSLWVDGPYLLSNTAVHTHHFATPIEAARFRFVSTGGGVWPAGNLRLGELVFHGELLGASHPDVVAKHAQAVLFDEQEDDLTTLKRPNVPFIFKYDDAYRGGKSLALTKEGTAGPDWNPSFGHAIPNWDFEIAEHPQPGQYRWLQFAWKALSPQTTGMALLIGGPWPSGGYNIVAGNQHWNEGVLAEKQITATPPQQWQVVRVDLWDLYQKPMRIQSMSLIAVGGGAAFDQIVLGRDEGDLPGVK